MVGPDCHQLFDVVIVQGDKPNFFTHQCKPFYESLMRRAHWDHITGLEEDKIYQQRSLFDFLCLTEWRGRVSLLR